jgi:hypothetical protein
MAGPERVVAQEACNASTTRFQPAANFRDSRVVKFAPIGHYRVARQIIT